ncbi:hypothetical protein DFH11DRAFT_1690493 [Phellopilus nigrolimitatus]|nr:hypothetical protein DFH11DRAFT_1690493 [Phellopilus nigrolimitatus]
MALLEEADSDSIGSTGVKKPKSNPTRRKDEEDGENGDEEDEEEEEYEIEAIIDAKRGAFKPGEYGYLVKWKGYDSKHNSWVSEKDAGNAKELIDDYFKRKQKSTSASKPPQRGRASMSAKASSISAKATSKEKSKGASPAVESTSASVVKRGRGKGRGKAAASASASEASEDEDAQKTKKKKRVNGSMNGTGASKREMEGHDERKYTTMKDLNMSALKNWESHVKQVTTVERVGEGLMIYFETTDNKYVREPSSTCAKRFPQKLIQFYESHLRWKLAEDDVGDS